MASTNQSPFYQRAESEYLAATTDEERISCLEIMIKECPKHKSSENMLRNLTNRLKRLKEGVEKRRKAGKGGGPGIKKAETQCVLVGFPNSGKSSIFNKLTGLNVKISPHPFTTIKPEVGTFYFENTPVQIIDLQSFPNHERGIVNSTDTLLLVIESLDQIKLAEEYLYRPPAKKIVILNKVDKLTEEEKRKISATLNSKYKNTNFLFFSEKATEIETEKLKKIIFETFPIIRVYTKEPKKDPSKDPMLLVAGARVKDSAEKILKGLSSKIKRARVWGPSSKFGGQVVGLEHVLKDKDVIEFQTT